MASAPLEPLTSTALVRLDARREPQEQEPNVSLCDRPFLYRHILAGMLVIVFLIGFLSFWVGFAPITGAVMSPGVLVVAGERKTVQHLEGGIVDEILVHEGDVVTKGQALVKLKQVEAAAELARLEGQQLETIAVIERLLAEQNGATEITLSEGFFSRVNDPLLLSIVSGQQQVLVTGRNLFKQQLSLHNERIAQANEEINGLREQIKAGEQQKRLLDVELQQLDELDKKGLISRTRVLARRQELASVEGDLGMFRSEVARIKKTISETNIKISELHAARIARITKEIREERARLFRISQRVTAARDLLERTTITAPADGEVVNLQVHSVNSVIRPGQPLMDILPSGERLIVETFINPNDIDEVHEGMSAELKLQSETRRNRIPIAGVVSYVSPDRLIDPQTGRAHYEAHIEISPKQGRRDANNYLILAGMSTDVFIVTGKRTVLDYLFAPFSKYIDKSFREQ